MTNKNKTNPKSQAAPSSKTIEDANKIANGIKKPGQTKEQTKLVAQGIIKGIETYKKQQKAKARELDKELKKAKKRETENKEPQPNSTTTNPANKISRFIPWVLLAITWICGAAYMIRVN